MCEGGGALLEKASQVASEGEDPSYGANHDEYY